MQSLTPEEIAYKSWHGDLSDEESIASAIRNAITQAKTEQREADAQLVFNMDVWKMCGADVAKAIREQK